MDSDRGPIGKPRNQRDKMWIAMFLFVLTQDIAEILVRFNGTVCLAMQVASGCFFFPLLHHVTITTNSLRHR